MIRYSSAGTRNCGRDAINEVKFLVKEEHRLGIEVIMDVVFNHTAEGNENGPILSFRGADNNVYYMLASKGELYTYSGCGNTFNCNHPVVRQFIVDCLR
ncbi:putative isoamylase [Rosa chinensis]|uniref:Putative isoamylase n=1 Tax=Rosa chinensis TaxID=74649 RepID=A0A2P6QC12_ROSCH|nr:putative isoamylase [Rosa chinensis]